MVSLCGSAAHLEGAHAGEDGLCAEAEDGQHGEAPVLELLGLQLLHGGLGLAQVEEVEELAAYAEGEPYSAHAAILSFTQSSPPTRTAYCGARVTGGKAASCSSPLVKAQEKGVRTGVAGVAAAAEGCLKAQEVLLALATWVTEVLEPAAGGGRGQQLSASR